ncbi:11654_t:CDS:2 [Funneliformis caledonium]|uniref:11654_t:CDS:1 n=1 Tax=Funneliformis caledonium TaxID=1117310 RepID=A0A9N9C0W9_9GLOM|nr:11654_t:CDS:2 [Funneliformis caledonium]
MISFVSDDKTYIQNNVFTSEELEEIRNMKTKDLPKMLTELLKYLGSSQKNVHNLLLEYESDESFNELDEVDVSRGESYSLAFSKHKNNKRIIQGLVITTRKAFGRRGDLILRKEIREYSTFEVGKDYESVNRTKLLKERELKSLKLKDMLFMILLRMDVSADYVCKITRSDTLQIPTNAIIRKTIDIVEGTNDNDNEDDALEDLQEAGIPIL